MTGKVIEHHLKATLPDCQMRVRDLTGTGDHFRVEVASSAFIGKGLANQHRMIYDALSAFMTTEIHALSIKTYFPNDWDDSVEEADQPDMSGVHIKPHPSSSEEENDR